jgi:hypothetical protein
MLEIRLAQTFQGRRRLIKNHLEVYREEIEKFVLYKRNVAEQSYYSGSKYTI